ncbi:MAG: carbon storage regulator [Gemmatimonadaceae bacterium]
MLILSRRPGDAIVIDGGIRIVVLASDKRGVRIGIEAPPHVSIVREEIVAQIVDENRRANAGPEAAALVGGLAPLSTMPGAPASAPSAAQQSGIPSALVSSNSALPPVSAPVASPQSRNGTRAASLTAANSSES